jgi:hypothetical protein
MKYVVIAIIALLMARADLFLGIVDKLLEKSEPAPVEVDASEVKSKELVPVAQDGSLKQTPRKTFLALLEDFQANPIAPIHERAMAIFKDNPTMFNQKLDQELEAQIFRWRDLMNNNEPEGVKFMNDLMNILQGENLDMMKRFYSTWMDINMENFIAAYTKTKDTNCTVAALFSGVIPEEEMYNEYVEREDILKAFVAREKIEPVHRIFANNCLLVLQIEIGKLAPKYQAPPEEAGATETNVIPVIPPDQGSP